MNSDLVPVGVSAIDNAVNDEVFTQVAGQLAPSSARSYRRALAEYVVWLGKPFYQATKRDIIDYRVYVAAKYPNTKTAQPKFSIIKRFYAEAANSPEIAPLLRYGDPAASVRGIQNKDTTQGKHIALEVDQVRAMLRRIPTERDRLIVHMLLRTALRRSELASLRVGMVEAVGPYWRIIVRGKGNKAREVKVPDDLKEDIDAYLATRPNATEASPLFVASTHNGETRGMSEAPLSDDQIYRIVRAAGARIGIAKLTAHSTRVTAVTTGLDNGASIQDMAIAAGHADVRTTMHYYRARNMLRNSPLDKVKY